MPTNSREVAKPESKGEDPPHSSLTNAAAASLVSAERIESLPVESHHQKTTATSSTSEATGGGELDTNAAPTPEVPQTSSISTAVAEAISAETESENIAKPTEPSTATSTQEEASTMPLTFGPFPIPREQIFHITRLTFCLVNLRPLLPGHVLICPRRPIPRISLLTAEELTDLFSTTQRVQNMLTKAYKADAFNVAVQDGAAAGQSVPHVHVHVIPRRWGDSSKEDAVYELLEGEDGDLGKVFGESEGFLKGEGGGKEVEDARREVRRQMFPVPKGGRRNRSVEEMGQEASWLRGLMEEEVERELREKVDEALAERK